MNTEMKEFYIDHDGIPLHAKLSRPAGGMKEGKCPLVILLHGYTGHMEERHILAIADEINSRGYAVFGSNCTDTERAAAHSRSIQYSNGCPK